MGFENCSKCGFRRSSAGALLSSISTDRRSSSHYLQEAACQREEIAPVPPPRNATLSPNAATNPTARDCHIAEITTRGRMAWQKATGYNQRSRGETLMGRWKTVVGPKLKARTFENQKTEAQVGVRVLNRMTELGRPSFERTA